MRALLPFALLVVGVGACEPRLEEGEVRWQGEPLYAEGEDLVDRAIAEATLVEEYLDDALARRYAGDVPSSAALVDRLTRMRSGDRILRVVPIDGAFPEWIGSYALHDDTILLNPNSESLSWAREGWLSGQEYGALSAEEVEALVGTMDDDEYSTLRVQAYGYLLGPATAVNVLMHEAAHAELGYDCCVHDEANDEEMDCDLVFSIGWLAAQGVYWERWVPESQWLDQVYWRSRQR